MVRILHRNEDAPKYVPTVCIDAHIHLAELLILPLGVLVSGKGTRFILANTEQLHGKIQEMSDRIRGLEDALQTLHGEHASDPEQSHPLMQPNLLTIKSTMGLYSGTQVTGADSSNKANDSNGNATEHMQVDQPRVERGSSEDTVTVSDHQAQTKQVSLLARLISNL